MLPWLLGLMVRRQAPGEAVYTTPGTYSWTCPAGVYTVSAVAIGPGAPGTGNFGGAGGGLGWANGIPVVPGNSYTVKVGASGEDSYFVDASTVRGGAASGRLTPGTYTGDGGGDGGNGGGTFTSTDDKWSGGGGGAGGYSGAGGAGGSYPGAPVGTTGAGGTKGGNSSGANGTGQGGGGSGLLGSGDVVVPTLSGTGRSYGGGGGGVHTGSSTPGLGGVRLIWGSGRSFPNNAS